MKEESNQTKKNKSINDNKHYKLCLKKKQNKTDRENPRTNRKSKAI